MKVCPTCGRLEFGREEWTETQKKAFEFVVRYLNSECGLGRRTIAKIMGKNDITIKYILKPEIRERKFLKWVERQQNNNKENV